MRRAVVREASIAFIASFSGRWIRRARLGPHGVVVFRDGVQGSDRVLLARPALRDTSLSHHLAGTLQPDRAEGMYVKITAIMTNETITRRRFACSISTRGARPVVRSPPNGPGKPVALRTAGVETALGVRLSLDSCTPAIRQQRWRRRRISATRQHRDRPGRAPRRGSRRGAERGRDALHHRAAPLAQDGGNRLWDDGAAVLLTFVRSGWVGR